MNRHRFLCFLLVLLFMTAVLTACFGVDEEFGGTSGEGDESMRPDANAEFIWKDEYAYGEIVSAQDVYNADFYFNGKIADNYLSKPSDGDAKYLLGGENETRVVNFPDGYMFTMPGADVTADLSLSALRNKFINENSVLTFSYEDKSPYGNTENGWNIYLNEWIIPYITSLDFLSANNIVFTRQAVKSTELIPGYTVLIYDYYILLSGQIEFPYYNIAIIREDGVYDRFYLMVMKTKNTGENKLGETIYKSFEAMVKSVTFIEKTGKAVNSQGQYEVRIPEFWSEETKAYYNKLVSQTNIDWGVFAVSLPSVESEIKKQGDRLEKELSFLQGSEALDYKLDILPTYTHIAWYDQQHDFPSRLAAEYAGGNGFNGKPVLQFSYQFTINNNSDMYYKTPIFGVLRGYYDEQFKKLARDIKAYGKPVLFRLNNEMNTDWTSYAGILTMLDPDFFIATWQRMYDIFVQEGVDNCIWIFNPIAKSCPFSNWGEAVNYMPGADYMQILGLTSYESGNETDLKTFKEMYQEVYAINSPFYLNYPWVISEFGCGAGGAKKFNWDTRTYDDTVLGRNAGKQARWVKEMFDCLSNNQASGYEFCKNIKGAVWFSANDYATVDGTDYIVNYFKLDDNGLLADTYKAFREGFARMK